MTDESRMFNGDATDWTVLAVLLGADESLPWSVEEVACEIGDHDSTIESLDRLRRAGLVHHLDGFFFPTRAARRFEALRS
jgi:predicted transcriptional regulator